MTTDETHFVTQMHPLDIGGVRDSGVASLMLLAASLGWNVLRKQHQPVKLLARDGAVKRLPTDSSCMISVFQSALSTIMVHTEDDTVATIELIDAIIAETKVDREHARRLRLAVGETPAEHRERLANDKVAQRRDEEEHLTQPVGDAWTDIYLVNEELQDTSALREGLMVPHTPPFDGEEHGELVSREPYVAHYSGGGNSNSKGYTYESVTSLERIWEDGYIDYECVVCGMAKGSPRAVGSHRQVHVRAGEVERDERYMNAAYRARRDERAHAKKEVEFVDELPEERVEAIVSGEPVAGDEVIAAMTRLLLPGLISDHEAAITALTQERDEAIKRLAEVEGEFDALLDLLNSRKKS